MTGSSGSARPGDPAARTNDLVDTRAERGSSSRRRARAFLALAFLFALLSGAVLVHRIADLVRGAPLHAVESGAVPLRTSSPAFVERVAALTETALEDGHRVEVLPDDAVFDRMLADVAEARESITLLGYYCAGGALGDRLAAALAERARAGVEVLFLGDHFGCRKLIREIRPPLEDAGVQVAAFRPVRWWTLHRAQHRMHARSVVVDGRVGYTGGFGIDDKWILDRPGEPKWREASVRFTGPAVARMQATFLAAWGEATGDLVTGEHFFPDPVAEPDTAGAVAGLLYSRLGLGPTTAERYLALTIEAAEQTLYLANSYFVPTPLLRTLLADAARRGVDVRLLVPGEHTDIPSTRHAGRAAYAELLEAGVRIWEYQPAMMHSKTIVADGVWANVGSLNLDNRSMRLNDESALLVFDAAFGARMDSIFLADLGRAREITLEEHRRRPLADRLYELVARVMAPLL